MVSETNIKNLECLVVERASGRLSEAKEIPMEEDSLNSDPSGFPHITISQAWAHNPEF